MASGRELARGHVLAPGCGCGEAFVTDPVSFWGGVSADDGSIIDVHHRDHGRSVAGTVLVMRVGRGSSSASAVLAESLRIGTGPAAIVLASADVILAAGSVVARELYGIECPIVQLDPATFDVVAGSGERRLGVDASTGIAVVRTDRRDSQLRGPGKPQSS
jgi:predicted aconitase with swiveling domain